MFYVTACFILAAFGALVAVFQSASLFDSNATSQAHRNLSPLTGATSQASPVALLAPSRGALADDCDEIMARLRRIPIPRNNSFTDKAMRAERQTYAHCFYEAEDGSYLMHGRDKHVISFSLFRHTAAIPERTSQKFFDMYVGGVAHNAYVLHQVMPGWVLRFYLADDLSAALRPLLKDLQCEVVVMKYDDRKWSLATMWRFLVADDESVSRFHSRDVDGRLMTLDHDITEQWERDQTPMCLSRPYRGHKTHVMAGLWGGTREFKAAARVDSVARVLEGAAHYGHTYALDQIWLTLAVWPVLQNFTTQFDATYTPANLRSGGGRVKAFCPVRALCYKVHKTYHTIGCSVPANSTVNCLGGSGCRKAKMTPREAFYRLAPWSSEFDENKKMTAAPDGRQGGGRG